MTNRLQLYMMGCRETPSAGGGGGDQTFNVTAGFNSGSIAGPPISAAWTTYGYSQNNDLLAGINNQPPADGAIDDSTLEDGAGQEHEIWGLLSAYQSFVPGPPPFYLLIFALRDDFADDTTDTFEYLTIDGTDYYRSSATATVRNGMVVYEWLVGGFVFTDDVEFTVTP